MRIHETQICLYDSALDEIGVVSEEWTNAAIDLNHVIAVRETLTAKSSNSIVHKGMAVVVMSDNATFFLNEKYKPFVKLWKGAI